MFFNEQPMYKQEEYIKLLKLVGSLSNLFSESNVPYLYYRVAENIFCRSFNAENLSRGDVSADASINEIGIGLKTFLHNNGNTLQKIAEFNRGATDYQIQDPRDIVETIGQQRNERINFTKRAHDLNEMIYHLVTRQNGKFNIYEENMDIVDMSNIRGIEDRGNNIYFRDGRNEYKFDKSKSTLFKRFITNERQLIMNFEVTIKHDPYSFLLNGSGNRQYRELQKKETFEHIYLPLYSPRQNDVPERSGLNQWNARGRLRDKDEVYIPIPVWIHKTFPNFFPYDLNAFRDAKNNHESYESEQFILELPNGTKLSAKICQSDGKALMSNPNSNLGKWLLRHVLQVARGQLVTYEMLDRVGIDSVIVTKVDLLHYRIDFAAINSFANFEEEFYVKESKKRTEKNYET